jgi:hypothetical protein
MVRMSKKKFAIILIAVIIIGMFISSCQVNEPHMPSWDVSLNVPLVKRNYTMMDLLQKSSDLKYYADNSRLVYYSQDTQLDKIVISDKLKIDALTKTASQTIGDINIASDSITANVNYDWASGLTAGSQTILPSFLNQTVSANFSLADQFLSIKIQSGTISLTVSNQFPAPVSITLSNFKLKNRISGEVIAQSSQSITIPAKSSGALSAVSVTPNVVVKNEVTLECNLACSGSSTNIIILPPYSFGVKAKFNNLVASEATAKIPVQDPVVFNNTIIVDEGIAQGTKFTSLKIDKGSLKISVDNNLDLNASLTIIIPNLKDAQQKVFSRNYFINRKQSSQILINNETLQDYTLNSGSGSSTNSISYTITITPQAATDFRTVKNTDGITGNISISSLQLSEFSGFLKPTQVSTERSSVSLNVQDLKNKLQFGQINFKNPIAKLQLNTTAQFEMLINGYIEAKNKIGQRAVLGLNAKTLGTNNIISATNTSLNINADSLSNFFKAFTIMPDSLIVYAGGTLNPSYKTISVKSTDEVSGFARLEFPFELGIKEAVFKDSVDMDISNDDRDQIKKINSLTAGLEITNGLAAAIDFSGDLYDENNLFLTEFPPKSTNPGGIIAIDGAEVNSLGEPTPKTQKVIVEVNKTDAEKISRAKYMRVTVKMNTTGADNSPVKFRTTDVFNFHAFASANYQVTVKENQK